MKVIRHSFSKWFNATEPHAAKLEGRIKAEEKCDGSLISLVFYNNEWLVSTNGMIDAAEASLSFNPEKNYKTLFFEAFEKTEADLDLLDRTYCYTFELMSPENRIVVSYPETKIKLIGVRDMWSLQELNPDSLTYQPFDRPKTYNIDTIDQALKIAKTLGVNEEGFVLVDEYFNRVKVKGAEYLAMHKIRSNDFSLKGFLVTVLNNTQDDLLAYFPEYKPYIEEVENKMKKYIDMVNDAISKAPWDADKKTFALAVKDLSASSILFKLYNNKEYDWKKEVLSIDNINRLTDLLELK